MSHPITSSLPPALTRADRAIINALIVGIILPLLDTTVVNIALHEIGQRLAAPLSITQWVVMAYTLAAASIVPASAWAVRRLGPKRLWLTCLWLFLIGAVLAGFAWNIEIMVIARVVQGIATGLLLPTMQTIVVAATGPDRSKAALTAMAVPSVIAPILGPLLGGFVLEYADWRMIFWLHVPICLLAIYLATRRLSADEACSRLKFDTTGFLLLCPGMLLTVYGISSLGIGVNNRLYFDLSTAVVGACLMAGFVKHARIIAGDALMNVGLLGIASFKISSLLLLLSSIAYYGGVLLLPLYLIQAGGYQPYTAGLLLALHGIGTLVARQKLPVMTAKWGERRVAIGAISLALVGSGLLGWPTFLAHPSALVVGMILRGAGIGLLTIQAMAGAYTGLERTQVPHASSMTRMLTHWGATLGAAGVAFTVHFGSQVSGSFSSQFGLAHLLLLAISAASLIPARKLSH